MGSYGFCESLVEEAQKDPEREQRSCTPDRQELAARDKECFMRCAWYTYPRQEDPDGTAQTEVSESTEVPE